jgi:hypothetical protein
MLGINNAAPASTREHARLCCQALADAFLFDLKPSPLQALRPSTLPVFLL